MREYKTLTAWHRYKVCSKRGHFRVRETASIAVPTIQWYHRSRAAEKNTHKWRSAVPWSFRGVASTQRQPEQVMLQMNIRCLQNTTTGNTTVMVDDRFTYLWQHETFVSDISLKATASALPVGE